MSIIGIGKLALIILFTLFHVCVGKGDFYSGLINGARSLVLLSHLTFHAKRF